MKPFIAADILLPAPQTDMGLWPALACDQFTSQPEYWQKAEALTQNAPSTLHITLPEAYLESPGCGRSHCGHPHRHGRLPRPGAHTRCPRFCICGTRDAKRCAAGPCGRCGPGRLTAMKKAPHRWCVPAKIPLWSVFRRALPCAGGRAAGNASYHDAAG